MTVLSPYSAILARGSGYPRAGRPTSLRISKLFSISEFSYIGNGATVVPGGRALSGLGRLRASRGKARTDFPHKGCDHEEPDPEEVMAKVLEGVRVLEMGTFITGPAAGMLLGDLGADIVKIEHPDGDPFRAYKGELYSPHFQTYNRNKRSVRLNTKLPEDLRALDALVSEADVFIQNFRPGVAE